MDTRNPDPASEWLVSNEKGPKMKKNVQMRAGWDLTPPMDRKFSAESGSGLGLASFGPKRTQMGPARVPLGALCMGPPIYGSLKKKVHMDLWVRTGDWGMK